MARKIITLSICINLLLLVIFYYLFIDKISNDKKYFADTLRLNSEYMFTKDMYLEFDKKYYPIKIQLDSLTAILKLNSGDSAILNEYTNLKNYLIHEYQNIEPQIQEKSWERLNVLIEEFCKENNIQLLIGANGMGTILYGDSEFDITEEIIRYVNYKYENGN